MSLPMTEPIIVRVFFDPKRLSKNERLHWAARRRLVEQAKEAAVIGWLQAGCPRSEVPVRVSFKVHRYRRLDDDNALSGCYAIRDALFNGRTTPNDSTAWVRLGEVTQETGQRFAARPFVDVIVEAAE